VALRTWAVLSAVLVLAGSARAASMFYIRGGGDGHGIGMSQYGSYGYALHGKGYRWILAHYYQHTGISTTDPNRIVRVLLVTGQAAFSGAKSAGGKQLQPGVTYSVRPNADGSLTLFTSTGKKVGRFAAPLTVSGPGPLQLVGDGSYRGSLQFRPDGAGGVQTVNALRLDDYVRGVISAEMPASWSAEALKVQAVAARTYAITTNVGGSDFDLYPDTRSQMYQGVAAETASTDAAVAATRGQIVTYNGLPAVTYFFNSSGGHTENIENVWPGATPEPWLRGVPDPYDGAGGDPYHHWGYDLTLDSAAAKLGSLLKGSLVGIRVTKHGSSPRILAADVVGSGGTSRVSGSQLQQAFGLLTTYAAFTTITTQSGEVPSAARASGKRVTIPHGESGDQAVVALVPLVRNLVAGSLRALHGTIFPVQSGAQVQIQQHSSGSWHTVTRCSLQTDGSYQAPLPGPGSYRVVYRGLDGPAVTVS
jgi:stage II sporulation protein D